jgi:hypothetical protein
MKPTRLSGERCEAEKLITTSSSRPYSASSVFHFNGAKQGGAGYPHRAWILKYSIGIVTPALCVVDRGSTVGAVDIASCSSLKIPAI